MRLIPRGPISAASRAWTGSFGAMTTIVARVTFELRPLAARVAPTAEPVRREDRWAAGASGAAVLLEPTDLAPLKNRADVLVVGSAHSPGRAVPEVEARIIVGELEKAICVTGARSFGPGGLPTTPVPFTRAPMDFTAAAGDDSWNVVGVRSQDRDPLGDSSRAPTVLPLGVALERRDTYVPPAGLGPIPPTWAPRADRLSAEAAAWKDLPPAAQGYWPGGDTSFFQAAPADQQLARSIRPDERIVLEHLHPQHPRLVTSLPGATVQAAIVDGSGNEPITMIADTLWIDSDRGIATVTWRSAKPTERVQGKDVILWLDSPDTRAPAVGRWGAHTAEVATTSAEALPFDSVDAARRSAPEVAAPASAQNDSDYERLATGTIGASTPGAAPPTAHPFGGVIAQSRLDPPPLAPPSPAPTSPALGPPAFASSSPTTSTAAPNWQVAVPPPPAPAPRIDTWKLHEEAASRKSAETPDAAVPVEPRPGAADEAASPSPPALLPAAAIEVAWIDGATDVDLAGRSRTLREQLEEDEVAWMSPVEAADGAADRARTDVARYLRRTRPLALDDLPRLLVTALKRHENERPFVVISGELTWTFDVRESIRAWIALGAGLAAEPRVKEAIETAERALSETAPAITEALQAQLDRVRDAVRAITRTVGATPIEAAVERHLVEERGFGRRKVWGASKLRAHLSARASRGHVPVYLGEDAGWQAPLVQKFPARLLAELRSRQDPTESSPVCLRAIAFGIELPEATPAR